MVFKPLGHWLASSFTERSVKCVVIEMNKYCAMFHLLVSHITFCHGFPWVTSDFLFYRCLQIIKMSILVCLTSIDISTTDEQKEDRVKPQDIKSNKTFMNHVCMFHFAVCLDLQKHQRKAHWKWITSQPTLNQFPCRLIRQLYVIKTDLMVVVRLVKTNLSITRRIKTTRVSPCCPTPYPFCFVGLGFMLLQHTCVRYCKTPWHHPRVPTS